MFVAYPLLSFTDILLEQCYNHALKYGGNGLGLNKKVWGIEKGKKNNQIVNPVFYVTEESHIHALFENIIRTFYADKALQLYAKEKIIVQSFMGTLGLYKLYEGFEWDKEAMKPKNVPTSFYDEREWRYLPDVLTERAKQNDSLPINFIPIEEFYDKEGKFKSNYFESINKEIEKHKLEFTADDIDYILVKDEGSLNEMTALLREAFSENDSQKLVTKLKMISKLIESDPQ
jgi:hypothetical protein